MLLGVGVKHRAGLAMLANLVVVVFLSKRKKALHHAHKGCVPLQGSGANPSSTLLVRQAFLPQGGMVCWEAMSRHTMVHPQAPGLSSRFQLRGDTGHPGKERPCRALTSPDTHQHKASGASE